MRKLILFISILFVSTIMYGQTDVVRNYTKPYFVKNVKVNDTLGTKRLIVTYGASLNKILASDAVGLATWVTATSVVPADTFYFNYCNGCAGVVGWKHIGDTIYADTSVIGTKYDIDSLGATVWRLTGNNILGTEFIGTLNNIPLIFKVNNIQSGKITPNTFGTTLFGYKAGNTSITGDGNTYIGTSAGENTTTGNLNTFIGNFSGQNTTVGYDNTFVGYNSGQQNTGMGNTFLGSNAGKTTITGSRNIAIGYNAEFVTTNSVDSLNIGNTIYGNMFTKNTTVKGNLTADTLGSYNQCIPKAYIHQIIGCSPVDFPTGITVNNIGTSSNCVDTAYISKAYITDMSVSTVDMELVTTPDTIVCWEGDSLKYSLVSDITGITMYNQIGDYTARSDSGYFDYINVNTMVANNTLDINSLEIHPTIGTITDRSPAGHFDSLYVYDTASLKDVAIDSARVTYADIQYLLNDTIYTDVISGRIIGSTERCMDKLIIDTIQGCGDNTVLFNTGVTIEDSLIYTKNAGLGKVLTSDANGVASWNSFNVSNFCAPADSGETLLFFNGCFYVKDSNEKAIDGITDTTFTWDDANTRCESLGTGWYLPNKMELDFIYQVWNQPANDGTYRGGVSPLSGFSSTDYWSSTVYSSSDAWYQNFDNGSQGNTNKTNTYNVRCVRR